MKLTISIAIVLFNQNYDEFLKIKTNLEELERETPYNYECFFISNNPNNKSLNNFFEMNNFSENIHVKVMTKNVGFGAGNNYAIEKCNSDIHIIMNPDIVISDFEGFLKAVEYMHYHNNVDLLSPKIVGQNGELQMLNRLEPTLFDLGIRLAGPRWFPKRQSKFKNEGTGYTSIQPILNASGSFMMLRTSSLKEAGGFDTRYFMYMEDTDLTKKIRNNGDAVFFPDFEVIHGWARENHTFRGIVQMIKSMIKYFNKWGWKVI